MAPSPKLERTGMSLIIVETAGQNRRAALCMASGGDNGFQPTVNDLINLTTEDSQ